ncbi:unnamed protein product [Tilletia controversa]|nr:unnamed protein product [Tilletia controversa]CAD6973243.1 unnamed protein product [Tilletia controversa]
MSTHGGSGPGSSSAGAANSPVFLQYNAVLTLLKLLTVANLKNVIKDMQQGSFRLYHIGITGKKADLQERITRELDTAKDENNVHLFTHIYDVIKRNSGRPGWGQALEASRVLGPGNTLGSTPGSSPNAGSSAAGTSSSYRYGGYGAGSSGSAPGSSGGVPYNKMHISGGWPGGSSAPGSGSSAAGVRPNGRPVFRPSPFFEVKQFVSPMGICPEAGPNERKNVLLHFTLSDEVQTLLQSSRNQVRLFCTQLESYNASVQSPVRPAPVIFPLTCEARVNDRLLTANLKGNRKVVGKVPPPNLNKDKALHLDGKVNKVELSYVNTTYLKYAMICAIVETYTIQSLVDKVKARPLTVEMVVNSILLMQQDDEIEAGAAKMTLRCPLSAMRIKVPSRSKKCMHRQCFDADTFFQLNEQTPSWNCPVCNTAVNPDDLILDQYVETILKQVPEDQDAIVVEPDASWHTEDGKFRSKGGPDSSGSGSGANGKGKEPELRKPAQEIIVMDLSPSPPPTHSHAAASSSAAPAGTGNSDGGSGPYSVPSSSATSSSASSRPDPAPARRSEPIIIDLTLSSDEDEPPPRPPPGRRPPPPPPTAGTAYGAQPSSAYPNGADAARAPAPRLSGTNSTSVGSASTGRPGQPGRSGSATEDFVRIGDTSGSIGAPPQRRTRDDDDDDDNVVLSPDRRRVRRRIQSPADEDEVDRSLQGSTASRSRDAGAGSSVRDGWRSRLVNGDDDDEDDDRPLFDRRAAHRVSSGGTAGGHAGEGDRQTGGSRTSGIHGGNASRSSNTSGAATSTGGAERRPSGSIGFSTGNRAGAGSAASTPAGDRSGPDPFGLSGRSGSSLTDARPLPTHTHSYRPPNSGAGSNAREWERERDRERERERDWGREGDRDRGRDRDSQPPRPGWRVSGSASTSSLPERPQSTPTTGPFGPGFRPPAGTGGPQPLGPPPPPSRGGANGGTSASPYQSNSGAFGGSTPNLSVGGGRPPWSNWESAANGGGQGQGSRAPSLDKSASGTFPGGRSGGLPPKPVNPLSASGPNTTPLNSGSLGASNSGSGSGSGR